MLFLLHHHHSFRLVMCVFTSSTLLLYLYKGHLDIELKDLTKAFLESQRYYLSPTNPL